MRQLGIPDDAIGIRDYPGVDEGAFTRFPDTQIGGNINPNVLANYRRGIAIDHGILDTAHPHLRNVPFWAQSRLSDRLDAAIIHEIIESTITPPLGLTAPQAIQWLHDKAVRFGPDTTLPNSSRALVILTEYRNAMRL